LNERQLRFVYKKAKSGLGATGDKILQSLELRLASVVYRGGLAPTIFAAKQVVSHGHVLVDGKRVDRSSYGVRAGQVVSMDSTRSAALVGIAQATDIVPPAYLEVDKQKATILLAREPLTEEIPANVEITKVIEFYAR
jgi:small subunit ribosomal protein S4